MKRARRLLLVLLTVLAGVVATGCGSGSSSGGEHDPAALVPATAPLYAEATVRPEGKLRDDVEAALRKVLRTDDPAGKIEKAIDSSGKDDGLTFKDDVDPWLGDRVGVALTSLNGDKADFVAVIDSKNDAKAQEALKKTKGDIVQRSYEGVDYRYDRKERTAAGVFGNAVVVGTEPGFRSAVDASKGESLADSNDLRAVRSKVAADRIGLFYLDAQGLLRTIGQAASSSPEMGAALQSLTAAAPKTIGAALQAQADLLRIDGVSLGTPKSASTGASGADVVAGLPGDSWLALGIGRSGELLDRTLDTIGGSGGITGVGVQALLHQFQQQTGLDLRRDVLSWMGDAGLFVTGTTSADLGGALVVKTSDPAKTRRVIAVVRRLVGRDRDAKLSPLDVKGVDDGFTVRTGSAPPIAVGLAGDRFVVSVGSLDAFKKAVAPAQPLSATPAFTQAATKLGDGLRPAFYLDFQHVVSLIGALAGSSPDFAKAKPYLDTFGAVVAGAKDEGDGVTRARFVVTLR
ncbi:MAG TPA: DUF3352 domain-containing protein [Solirubrobacteraceae bacterium]